jgi:hypothetical protein
MKRFIGMMCLGLLVASFSAACGGDDEEPPPDAMMADAMQPDASPPLTFESFVIDMVQAGTADNTDPVPYDNFSMLPESGDPAAFDILFP